MTYEGTRKWKNGTVNNLNKLGEIGVNKKNSSSINKMQNLTQLVLHCIKYDEQERCEFLNILGSPESAKSETKFFKKTIKPSGKRKNKHKLKNLINQNSSMQENSTNVIDSI